MSVENIWWAWVCIFCFQCVSVIILYITSLFECNIWRSEIPDFIRHSRTLNFMEKFLAFGSRSLRWHLWQQVFRKRHGIQSSINEEALANNAFFTEKWFGKEYFLYWGIIWRGNRECLQCGKWNVLFGNIYKFFISLWNYPLNRLQNIYIYFFLIDNKFHFKFFLVPGTA